MIIIYVIYFMISVFLFVSSFQLDFNFFILPTLTCCQLPSGYHVLCCHNVHVLMVLSYEKKCWLVLLPEASFGLQVLS